MLVSVCLLGVNLKVCAKPQKLSPSRETLCICVCHLKFDYLHKCMQHVVYILTLQTAAERSGGEKEVEASKKKGGFI
jgi:hypothetical protein